MYCFQFALRRHPALFLRLFFVFFAASFGGATSIVAQQTGTPRSLFAADYQKKIAAVVRADNTIAMQVPIRDIHDAQPLPNSHWLLQTNFGEVIELDHRNEVVWKYVPDMSKGRVEIHAFRRLENGLTMIAESGPSRIVEVDKTNSIRHVIPLTVSKPDPHRDTRLVRPTSKGEYLVAHEAEGAVRRYDRAGKIVWEYSVGSKLYSAIPLANGHVLIGAGDGHRVFEVDEQKQVVWELKEKDLPGVQLAWITMVDRLPNGNTWIVNCHAGPNNPQILEVDPDKKIVWSFKDFERFGNSLPVAIPIGP